MTAGFDFLRDVDRRCRGNPVFIVSGIPGSVGSASRALWRELAPMLESDRSFRVWPFEGDLAQLLREAPTTIAEMYPRIAYAIAVAPTPPTRREAPRKKGEASVREMWVSRFRASQWLKRFSVTILDDERAELLIVGEGRPCHGGLGLAEETGRFLNLARAYRR